MICNGKHCNTMNKVYSFIKADFVWLWKRHHTVMAWLWQECQMFYREHGTGTVTVRRSPFHTHTKSALYERRAKKNTATASSSDYLAVRPGSLEQHKSKYKPKGWLALFACVCICFFTGSHIQTQAQLQMQGMKTFAFLACEPVKMQTKASPCICTYHCSSEPGLTHN